MRTKTIEHIKLLNLILLMLQFTKRDSLYLFCNCTFKQMSLNKLIVFFLFYSSKKIETFIAQEILDQCV